MDPTMVRRHLQMAQRHVVEDERHIARQRETVRKLELRNPDSVTLRIARGLLREVERAHQIHVADLDRLREQLGLKD
jgi:hypothetical protein